MAKKSNHTKFAALITYAVAVAALIVGLVLPLETATIKDGVNFDNMPVMQLTGALAALGILKTLPFGVELSPLYSLKGVFGQTTFDIGAALLLAYAVATVIALIMLIPVIAGKKDRAGAVKCAFVAELIAETVLLLMVVANLAFGVGNINLSVLIPFGVVLLALAVQTIYYHGGSGVIKTVMVILSACALFGVMLITADNTPALFDLTVKLAEKVNAVKPFDLGAGLFVLNGADICGNVIALLVITDFELFKAEAFLNFTALAVLAITGLNLLFDIFGMGKRTNSGMLTANIVRYALQIIAVIVLMVGIMVKDGCFGVALLLLAVISIIQLVIEIIRRACYKKPVKETAAAAVAEEDDDDDVPDEVADIPDSDEEYDSSLGRKAWEKPAPVSADASSNSPARTGGSEAEQLRMPEVFPPVFNANTNYEGDEDEFIKTLTHDEKLEFKKVFLDRTSVPMDYIPAYTVGGDNKKFFSNVFIYFARVREFISDGLMHKMYQEISKH